MQLKNLPAHRQANVLRQLTALVHEAWRHCTDEFSTPARAEEVLRARVQASDQVLFVALGHGDVLAGTGSVGHDDFYEGFARSNGVRPGYVGRDLCTAGAWRGLVIDGLKVWEHLLQARLHWVDGRSGTRLTVFTEPGPVDLPALYGRLGAEVLRQGLDHRHLGRGAITMLGYPVRRALQRLAALQQHRRAGAHTDTPAYCTWPAAVQASTAPRTTGSARVHAALL